MKSSDSSMESSDFPTKSANLQGNSMDFFRDFSNLSNTDVIRVIHINQKNSVVSEEN